jgi:hypothetical protein
MKKIHVHARKRLEPPVSNIYFKLADRKKLFMTTLTINLLFVGKKKLNCMLLRGKGNFMTAQ